MGGGAADVGADGGVYVRAGGMQAHSVGVAKGELDGAVGGVIGRATAIQVRCGRGVLVGVWVSDAAWRGDQRLD